LEFFWIARDIVFRVKDDVLAIAWLEGEIVNPVFALGAEPGEFGPSVGFNFGSPFLRRIILRQLSHGQSLYLREKCQPRIP